MKTLLLPLLCIVSGLSAQTKGLRPVTQNSTNGANSNTYAVIVGISDYQDDGIPDLQYAHRDAEAFEAYLRSEAGGALDDDHIKSLYNEEATVAQFAISLDWLWEVVGKGDRAIIYFSGHGDVERKSLTQPGYLLCWDAPSKVYMAGGAFNVRDMQEVVSTLSVQNEAEVILITDACRAGTLSGSGVQGSQATATNLAKQYANEIKILSCQPDEYSVEGPQWGGGRGAFSYHLMGGLVGLADANDDGGVTLLEIGRYLEDKVSAEVAPQSQIPMTVGSRGASIAEVNSEMLLALKTEASKSVESFAMTDSRGIVDEVLAAADTAIVQLYKAFENALADGRYLGPSDDCAEYYFATLSQEPQVERLWSTMKRNYAAALQDDAQQVMNTMLKTGLTERVLKDRKFNTLYAEYPAYLQKAADLLGQGHYMYDVLLARKHFFSGLMTDDKIEARKQYHQAMAYQPDMPHAMLYLLYGLDTDTQQDSIDYYFNRIVTLVPGWIEPYIARHKHYITVDDSIKAIKILDLAFELDSTSVLVSYQKAQFYNNKKFKDLARAIYWYEKTITSSNGDVCFPCATNNLGNLYLLQREFEKAEKYYLHAITLDSTFFNSYVSLGGMYGTLGRLSEAEAILEKAYSLDTTALSTLTNIALVKMQRGKNEEGAKLLENINQREATYNSVFGLAQAYHSLGRVDTAVTLLNKAIEMDSFYPYAYNMLGNVYSGQGRREEAIAQWKKVLELNPDYGPAMVNIGWSMLEIKDYVGAETIFSQALETKYSVALPWAHAGLASIYLEDNDYEKALQSISDTRRYDPNFSTLPLTEAKVFIGLGRLDEAKAILDQLNKQTPGNASYELVTAIYHAEAGNTDEAFRLLDLSATHGMKDLEEIEKIEPFESMKDSAQWKAYLEKHFSDEK